MKLADGRAGSAAVLIGILTTVAVAVAVIGYVDQSSDAAWAGFISAANVSATANVSAAANVSASDTHDPSSIKSSAAKGSTGCPVGQRKLPTQVHPLP